MSRNIHLSKTQQAYINDALSIAGIVGRFIRPTFFERLEGAILLGEPVREEEDLSNGYVCDREDSIARLALALENEIHNSPRYVLFYNECARVGDPNPYEGPGIVNVLDEVYHFLRPQSTRSQIEACIIEAETGFAFGIIFQPSEEDAALLSSESVSADVIIRCAASATHIIVGVYDGESYLMCRMRETVSLL